MYEVESSARGVSIKSLSGVNVNVEPELSITSTSAPERCRTTSGVPFWSASMAAHRLAATTVLPDGSHAAVSLRKFPGDDGSFMATSTLEPS